ncbi:synaptotagmin-3-like [Cynara cardunculus var. scolymus]|uniref:synaptotagmin-3-like n=1 Tax=Cynara cardunculus var. scolymus TaxID=59895 RepID=UPI000D62D12D|nr:synaptotagmin-3-like [Cynara cardunculus var. scolymus]
MGFLSIFWGIIGVGIGTVLGVCVGFYFFIYSDPKNEAFKDPVTRPISELDTTSLQDLIPEIPLWLKNPDYDRVDWLNRFVLNMWPYLDKAICATIRQTTEPIVADYVGHGHRPIEAITFETLSLGTLPPIIQGVKVYETNENQLVIEPAIKWAGNPNIVIAVKISSLRIKIQLVDLQVFAIPRVTLKPLVPSFPCFSNVVVSLMDKPHIDFGMKVLGGDLMSIPGLYRLVQDIIKKEVAKLYLWPQTLEIPILDSSFGAMKKPVGVLHVKVLRATKLMKMDILGLSDPYVKLKLSGEMLPSKKTTIKKKTLNPVWNETFKLVVKDPQAQTLQVNVYDWDKVGSHDRLGMQIVPLKVLRPNETKELTLDLLKNTNIADPQKKQQRGQIVLEMTYAPFKEDSEVLSGPLNMPVPKENGVGLGGESPSGAGVLLVTVQGAEDVEGEHHNNPYAMVIFRGETKKTKIVKRSRDPKWNEEFQFMLDEPPINDKIHVQIMSKRSRMSFYSKELLGYVDINLADVVNNGRINHKFHLIDSKNGLVHVELRWRET